MKVYLNEITEQGKDLSFTQADKWLNSTVTALDEAPRAVDAPKTARSIDMNLNLRRVDEIFVVTGKIDTALRLLCSRCAQNFHLPAGGKLELLFSQDPKMVAPQTKDIGVAKSSHDFSEDNDFDMTYLEEDFIDLSQMLKEQLQLNIPFQPLCQDNCKGLCGQCGINWNEKKCTCAKELKNNPFAGLKNGALGASLK